jgi:hypothetical protein
MIVRSGAYCFGHALDGLTALNLRIDQRLNGVEMLVGKRFIGDLSQPLGGL